MYEEKLKELGIEIPVAPKPLAAYVTAKKVDKYVYTAGQLPVAEGKLQFEGKMGKTVSIEDGTKAAKLCAINCLSAIKSVTSSLDDIEEIVKLTAFVASEEGFNGQPQVANGASEFVVEVFGEAGKHSRSAVGVSELPLNAPVEVEMIVKLK